LFTRHISFLALHWFMMSMYWLRPTPSSRNASAACGVCVWGGGGGMKGQ
jgi:hypothetical protein